MTQNDDQYEQFMGLFARHERAIRGFVRSLLPTGQDVDDVMQEVGLVCWRKFASFQADQDDRDSMAFIRWACVVARFEVMKHIRKLARNRLVLNEQVLELLADAADVRHERAEAERNAVEGCLQKLGESERQLLLSIYTPGTSVAALASQLGQKTRRLYSKLDALRDLIADCVRQQLMAGDA